MSILLQQKETEDSYTENLSQSETVDFAENVLKQANRAEPRRGTRIKIVPLFFGETIFLWNPKDCTRSSKVTIGTSGTDL